MVILTTEKILKTISTDWKNLTSIQNDLKLKGNLDIRYLKVKLKGFERKKLVECYVSSGEKYYKCINDILGLEKKEIFPKRRLTNKKNSLPKNKPVSKERLVQTEKTSENSDEISIGMKIMKVVKLKENVKAEFEFLKKNYYNESRTEALKKIQEEIEEITLELIEHSYFLCSYCNKTFTNDYDLNKHKLTHIKFANKFFGFEKVEYIKCQYCDAKYTYESDLKSHEFTAHMNPRHLDLHGLYVKEAIFKVKEKLIEYNKLGCKEMILIHGYHYGHALRDYFRSSEFVRAMKNFGFALNNFQLTDLGTTGFSFRIISKK